MKHSKYLAPLFFLLYGKDVLSAEAIVQLHLNIS